MMIGDLIRPISRLPDLDALAPVVVERIMRESRARQAVRVFQSTRRAPAAAGPALRVFHDDETDRFVFHASIFPCARPGERRLVRWVIDTGASRSVIPRSLGYAGVPATPSRMADGRIVETRETRLHLFDRGSVKLLTFDGLQFVGATETDGLIGMDILGAFDFSNPSRATVTLRSPEAKTCRCD